MTVTDRDIWSVASLYVTRYGDDAVAHASARAAELLAAGDRDAEAVWLLVVNAIAEVQRHERRSDEPVN